MPLPLPVSVTGEPMQVEVLPVMPATGGGFTVTVMVDVFWQPFASVPVTVYVVVAEGVTLMDVPVALVLHE